MARKRMIDPSIWTDVKIGSLSRDERLLFIGCFSNADDEGRLPGNPAFLRSVIFPYDDLSITEVRQMRDRIAATCKNFVTYAVDGNEYIAFRKWREYQSVRYPQPSKYPAPPEQNDCDSPTEGEAGSLTQDCGKTDATLPQACVNDVSASRSSCLDQVSDEVEVEVEVKRSTQDEVDLPPDATPTERLILHEFKQIKGYPLDVPTDLEHIRALAVDFPTVDLLDEAKKWRTNKLDKPLKPKSNPRLQFRNWCANAAKWQSERSERSGRSGKLAGSTVKTGKFDDLIIR
jgi:hypothetical protein